MVVEQEKAPAISPIAYYSPETYLFPEISQRFASTGGLDPMALYLILDWKAPRARTRHRSRLARIAGNFGAAAREIAADLKLADEPEQQLGILLTRWGFRLPTASAILAVLYPEVFTIYDIRVCNALQKFHHLGNIKWSHEAWTEYQRFVVAVRATAPQDLSLRDCDRWLWGRDKEATLLKELTDQD